MATEQELAALEAAPSPSVAVRTTPGSESERPLNASSLMQRLADAQREAFREFFDGIPE